MSPALSVRFAGCLVNLFPGHAEGDLVGEGRGVVARLVPREQNAVGSCGHCEPLEAANGFIEAVIEDLAGTLDHVSTLAGYVLQRTTGIVGFFGASSMERLPTEIAMTENMRRFKSIPIEESA